MLYAILCGVLQDLQARSDIAFNESKKAFASDLARVESSQSELKTKNIQMKKELDVSQEQVKNLTATMKDLGKNKLWHVGEYNQLCMAFHFYQRPAAIKWKKICAWWRAEKKS